MPNHHAQALPELVGVALGERATGTLDRLAEPLWSHWRLAGLDCFSIIREAAGPEMGRRLRQRQLTAQALSRVQRRERATVCRALQGGSARYMLLKALDLIVPDDRFTNGRCSYDIDIGVSRDDLPEVTDLLRTFGYQAAVPRDAVGPFRLARHYETYPFQKVVAIETDDDELLDALRAELGLGKFPLRQDNGTFGALISWDIHLQAFHAISLAFFQSRLVERVDPSGVSITLPESGAMTALRVVKIYFEGVAYYRTGIHAYYDLCITWRAMSLVEKELCLSVLREWNCEAPGYYVLRRLPEFGIALEPGVASALAEWSLSPPERTPLDCNDLGDMWPKLVGNRTA